MDTKEICELFMEIYNDKPYSYNYNLEKSEKLINKWNNNGIITYIKDNKLLGFIGGIISINHFYILIKLV